MDESRYLTHSRFEEQAAAIEARKEAHRRKLLANLPPRQRKRQRREILAIATRPSDHEAVARRREQVMEALTGEVAALAAEQAKDERRYVVQGHWVLSLDSRRTDDGATWHDTLALGRPFLSSYQSDSWTDAVCALVDQRREIDAWSEAA